MSYTDFDKTIDNEIIVLSHISSKGYFSSYNEFFSSWTRYREKKEKEKNKSDKEIKEEVEKEIFEEKEKLKDESLKLFYKIDEKNKKELKDTFNSSKLKVNLNNAQILINGKICGISENKCIIYDNKYFNKLYEIEIEKTYNIRSVIELDNNDLIFFSTISNPNDRWSYDSELLIYRLKNKKYYLLQKIIENRKGYKMQKSYSGCSSRPKKFSLLKIKKLSCNRFMSISNYGIRLYSLNNNNQYSLVLMETHLEGIEIICEINENEFIICTKKHYGISMRGRAYDYLFIEKMNIRDINKTDLEKKLNEFSKGKGVYSLHNKEIEKFDEKESKELISSLKLTCSFKTIFEYSTYRGSHNFSNFQILKNKYFIILVDNNLLIFNLLDNTLIKRYTFLTYGEKDLYKNKFDIEKWKNNDNEFLLSNNDYITLIKLDENNIKEKIKIDLKIIGYYCLNDALSLKFDEENSLYYSLNDDCIILDNESYRSKLGMDGNHLSRS